MKKLIALVLSFGIILGSYVNVAAAEKPDFITTPGSITTSETTPVDQNRYKTVHPGQVIQSGFSASVIYNSFSAHRQSDGKVSVLINETFNSVRGYYEHLATDVSGENFTPNKNTAYHTTKEGLYQIILSADSVSSDGYVYLRFGFDPVGVGYVIDMGYFKIPVDYNTYKVVNDNFQTLAIGEKFTGVSGTQKAVFDAKATKLGDSSVEVIVNINNSNTSLWFNHLATSKDGDIFIPQRDTWYYLGSGTQNNKSYRFVLPEKNVSSDGYVYLNVCFNLSTGMQEVGQIKLFVAK